MEGLPPMQSEANSHVIDLKARRKILKSQPSTVATRRQQAVCVRRAHKIYGTKRNPHVILDGLNMTVPKGTMWVIFKFIYSLFIIFTMVKWRRSLINSRIHVIKWNYFRHVTHVNFKFVLDLELYLSMQNCFLLTLHRTTYNFIIVRMRKVLWNFPCSKFFSLISNFL